MNGIETSAQQVLQQSEFDSSFGSVADNYNYYYADMNKAAALTTTSGYFNAIFGAYATVNLNTEQNVWALQAKHPYTKSGYRIVTSLPSQTQTSDLGKYGQVKENGAIPPVQIPTVNEIQIGLKMHTQVTGNSFIQNWLATQGKDDVYGSMAQLRLHMGTGFGIILNDAISRPAEEAFIASSDFDRAANIDAQAMEPLDRLISSKAEADAVKPTGSGTRAGYYTPHGDASISRNAGTTFDSTVLSAGGDTINADNGQLERSLLIRFVNEVSKRGGGRPSTLLTNWDVNGQLQQLFEDQNVQQLTESNVSFSVNGVDTVKGMQAGVQVSAYQNIPIIVSRHIRGAASDTSEIGRIYALNQRQTDVGDDHAQIGIAVATPIIYGENGMSQGLAGAIAINRLGTTGMWASTAEMVMTKSVSQGKIRDIGNYTV